MVDLDRPSLCADRIDGIFLPAYSWLHVTNINEINEIYKDLLLLLNEKNEMELGFLNTESAKKMYKLNMLVNQATHNKKDFCSLYLLSKVVRELINKNIIVYDDLYKYGEDEIIDIIESVSDKNVKTLWNNFVNLKNADDINMSDIKEKSLNPLVLSKRLFVGVKNF